MAGINSSFKLIRGKNGSFRPEPARSSPLMNNSVATRAKLTVPKLDCVPSQKASGGPKARVVVTARLNCILTPLCVYCNKIAKSPMILQCHHLVCQEDCATKIQKRMGLVWVRQCKSCRANVSHVIEVPTPEELATIRAAYEKIGVTPTTSDKTDERFAEIDIGSMDLDVSYDMEGQALASSSSSSSSYSACVAKPLPPSIATVSINSFFDDNSMDMDSVYDLEVQALNSSLTVTSYVGYVAYQQIPVLAIATVRPFVDLCLIPIALSTRKTSKAMDDLVLGTPGRPALASYGSQRRQRRLLPYARPQTNDLLGVVKPSAYAHAVDTDWQMY